MISGDIDDNSFLVGIRNDFKALYANDDRLVMQNNKFIYIQKWDFCPGPWHLRMKHETKKTEGSFDLYVVTTP